VAVDRWGNVAAVTHTINTVLWGNTGLFVGGVSVPDAASFQQAEIKRAGPGHRLPDAMSPLIVARDGRPTLASTAIGGGLHQRNIQILAGVLEFGLETQAACAAPAFLAPDLNGTRGVARVPAKAFDPGLLGRVRALGQEVKELGPNESAMFIGYWAGVAIDPKTGRLRGAGTPELPVRSEGY
jgi:gamma-glutamyltranspeptidase/glutathione hydrolase